MFFPESLRRWRFRQLVALFGVCTIYDIVWFILNRDVEDDDSGGLERNVRTFSRYISYVSFFWRILLSLLLEKASLDFIQIVKGKKTNLKHAESLEFKVEQIIKNHEENDRYYEGAGVEYGDDFGGKIERLNTPDSN